MYKPMRFWGTGAAGAIPTPFCKCEVCENARRVGGKEVRFRSAFRLNEKVMIDIGADYLAQAVRLGEDLAEVEHYLFTHLHWDHFQRNMFGIRDTSAVKPPKPMIIYFVDEAYAMAEELLAEAPRGVREEYVIFKKLEFGKTYQIDVFEVTPLRGRHSTPADANFLVKLPDGRYMYYALDTGYYYEETVEFLENYKLDILINECTFPMLRPHRYDHSMGHMDIQGCIDTFDMLLEKGIITKDTEIYLSHIAGKGLNHQQLEDYFAKLERDYKVQIAYDGLSIAQDA